MSIFETLREQIPLNRIVQANGSGKTYCVAPDHPGVNPSMPIYGDHVHCFAGGYHGHATDVWAEMRWIGCIGTDQSEPITPVHGRRCRMSC